MLLNQPQHKLGHSCTNSWQTIERHACIALLHKHFTSILQLFVVVIRQCSEDNIHLIPQTDTQKITKITWLAFMCECKLTDLLNSLQKSGDICMFITRKLCIKCLRQCTWCTICLLQISLFKVDHLIWRFNEAMVRLLFATC